MSHTILVSKQKWPFLSLIDTYLDYIYYILISDSLKLIDADIHIKGTFDFAHSWITWLHVRSIFKYS